MHSTQTLTQNTTHHDTLPVHANAIPAPYGIAMVRVGRILAGRYRLEKILGYGAMGEVYRATDLQCNRQCAVKLVLPAASLTLQAHQRLGQECKVISQLFHPNIVEVRDFGEESDGTRFLVMELLEGVDLRTMLGSDEQLPLGLALHIARSVGAALQYAHEQKVVHRDINPNNIFLARSENPDGSVREVVKVLDFGLAKFLDEVQACGDSNQLTKGMVIGTPAYVPPEAGGAYGGASSPSRDQWSLAVVLYRMLGGRLPFDGSNVRQLYQSICHEDPPSLNELVPGLPKHVVSAIHTALSKQPEARFPTIKDFLRALDGLPPALGRGSGVQALPTTVGERGAEAEHTVRPRSSRLQKTSPLPTVGPSDELADTLATPRPTLAVQTASWQTADAAAAEAADDEGLPEHQPLQTVRISAEQLAALANSSRSDQEAAPAVPQVEIPTARHRYSNTLMQQAVPPPLDAKDQAEPEPAATQVETQAEAGPLASDVTPLSASCISFIKPTCSQPNRPRPALPSLASEPARSAGPPGRRPSQLPGLSESTLSSVAARRGQGEARLTAGMPGPKPDIGSRITQLAAVDAGPARIAQPDVCGQSVPQPLSAAAVGSGALMAKTSQLVDTVPSPRLLPSDSLWSASLAPGGISSGGEAALNHPLLWPAASPPKLRAIDWLQQLPLQKLALPLLLVCFFGLCLAFGAALAKLFQASPRAQPHYLVSLSPPSESVPMLPPMPSPTVVKPSESPPRAASRVSRKPPVPATLSPAMPAGRSAPASGVGPSRGVGPARNERPSPRPAGFPF